MEEQPTKPKKHRTKQPKKLGEFAEDPNFAQESRVWQKLFVERIAPFTAVDPDLDIIFADKWFAAIEALEDHTNNENQTDLQQQARQDLLAYFNSLRKPFQDLEYYVGKAFPNDHRILMEFGFDKIYKYINHENLRALISALVTMTIVADYQTELNTAGLPANWVADTEALLDSGGAFVIGNERAQRLRIRATTQRAKLYNNLYSFWKRVNAAAPIAFPNQPVTVALWNRK